MRKNATSIIILVVILGLAVYVGYRLWQGQPEESTQEKTTPTTEEQPEESTAQDLSTAISKSFISTMASATVEPEDIGLASFVFDAEPLTAVAELSSDVLASNFKAKWFYLEPTPALQFYTEIPTKSTSGKYLITTLKFNQLSSEMKKYQPAANTFPIGNYKVDWYANGKKVTSTEFVVSGQ